MIRINKYLAQCGVASRRNADEIVSQGRVTVNGEVINSPGYMIDEVADAVRVDGLLVTPVREHTYIVLNKPAGYLTSLFDPHHGRTVMDLIGGVRERVYPVGRLDLDTEGTLLFTNDGELAHRLTHPRYRVKRIYNARVKGEISRGNLARFSGGIELPDGSIGHARAELKATKHGFSDIVLELTEGRKREVKHLCEAVGHPVMKLVRVSFAGITCDRLPSGHWRPLSKREIRDLKGVVGL